MKTYAIDGGIGKQIMFTAMINELANNTKEGKINIVSPYSDIFIGHPKVKYVWDNKLTGSPEMIENTSDFIFYEPYRSNFALDKEGHLFDFWCKGLNIDRNKIDKKPILNYMTDDIMNEIEKITSDIGDFIVVQFTGGQSPLDYSENSEYIQGDMHFQRNYPIAFAHKLVSKIKEKYPDLTIIDYSLPNEHPDIAGTVRIKLPYIGYPELLKRAKTYIGIDSSLLHLGAASGTNGIGLFGGIPHWQFGWDYTKPLTNFNGKVSEFDPFDPYYICVDTNRVLKELNKYIKEK